MAQSTTSLSGRVTDKSGAIVPGASVKLTWLQGPTGRSQTQLQAITAGDGYASQNMSRLHFGLGPDARIVTAVIQWPSGRTQTLDNLKVGIIHRVEEPGP